ncbi:MAG: glutamine-hydrolyzing GMP synthase, partial [Dissulfurimicrobium sp.]
MKDMHRERILILDFGSQTTQLIARRVREAKVYCEIHPFSLGLDEIRKMAPKGIILSGGPASVYDQGAPKVPSGLFRLGIPILGICYGMQLTAHIMGGQVEKGVRREFGPARLVIEEHGEIFQGLAQAPVTHQVWMSHGDRIDVMPEDFVAVASSGSSPVAAMRHKRLPIFGVQFHPEVVHTEIGDDIIRNFLFRVCGCRPVWDMGSFVTAAIEDIRARVGSKRVICALSGGVDSTVTALIVNKAIGGNLISIFVNNGLLRKGEAEAVLAFLNGIGLNVHYVDAAKRFLERLKGVAEPERKRKIIGEEFIRIFEEEAGRIGQVSFLAQGT